MNFLLGNLSRIIFILPTVLIALIGHETAHAWMSVKLGDPTPKIDGRLSINPLHHLDPIGTILMILTGFGWARPVSVNPMYYKDRKKGMALVALAGPAANIIMAALGMIIGVLLLKIFQGTYAVTDIIQIVTYIFVRMNLSLFVFNLIPIPPLDGSKILGVILPNKYYYIMLQYEQYSMIILMILAVTGAFDRIIGTGADMLFGVIFNMASAIVF